MRELLLSALAYLCAGLSVSAYAMHRYLEQRMRHIPRWAFVVTVFLWPYTIWLYVRGDDQ